MHTLLWYPVCRLADLLNQLSSASEPILYFQRLRVRSPMLKSNLYILTLSLPTLLSTFSFFVCLMYQKPPYRRALLLFHFVTLVLICTHHQINQSTLLSPSLYLHFFSLMGFWGFGDWDWGLGLGIGIRIGD